MAQYFQTPGPWGTGAQKNGYSQCVTTPAGARVAITAGQPGIDLSTGTVVQTSLHDQIEAVFDTLDSALQAAGVHDGVHSAHKMTCFFMDMRNEAAMLEIFRRRYPKTRPALVSVGVAGLALQGMALEVQVEAVVP